MPTPRCKRCNIELYRHVSCDDVALLERGLTVVTMSLDSIIRILITPPREEPTQ